MATADVLTEEILKFLDRVEIDILSKLKKGDFAVYTKSLIDRKTERDKDLSTEVVSCPFVCELCPWRWCVPLFTNRYHYLCRLEIGLRSVVVG